MPSYGHQEAVKALAQIDEAPPEQLRMLVVWGPRPYLPNPRGVADLIAEQFAALGLEVIIEQAAGPAEFFESVRQGEHDLILSGYIAENPDPVDFLAALLSSQRIPSSGIPMASTTNLGGFSDLDMDRRLAAAQDDPDKLLAVNELFEDQRPLVPLMYGATVAVHNWRVRDFELDPRGIPSFAELSIG